MQIEYFNYLQTVAECQSIRQAASKLHLKQQHLGTIIKNMETEYEITIFNRSPRGITLTEDGQFFLERIQKINQLQQELKSTYLYPSKQKYSLLAQNIYIYVQGISTPGNFITIIDAFHKYFPNVDIQIKSHSQNDIFQFIADDPQSLGIIYTPINQAEFLATLPQGLSASFFVSALVSAITSRRNKQAQKLSSISIKDFANKELALYSADALENNVVFQLLQHYGIMRVKHTVNNPAFLIDLLQTGDYWTLGKIDQSTSDKLIAIPFQEDIIMHSYFVYNSEAANSFIIKSFIKIAKNLLNRFNNQYIVK